MEAKRQDARVLCDVSARKGPQVVEIIPEPPTTIKSVDLVLAYIQRILEVEPIINAVIDHCFNDALRDAEAADLLVVSCTKSVKQLSQEKPLLGVPFSVKDGIAVQDMLQDAGSLMYEGNRSTDDSPAVALMRAAGAIPLLVTNVPELCIWGDTHNLLYGTTVNPHDTRRGPGGSSGGEGSLLASAGSLIGLGTDMVGGVRIPAAYCGVFGHKPTSGVVPNTGLLPDVGENMREYNCVGPMTRYSEDLLLVLKVLAGSEAYQLRLEEEVRLERLKVFFTETDGRVFCSYVTAEARQAVIKVAYHFKKRVGSNVRPLHVPELPDALSMWYKVSVAKEPKLFDLEDAHVFTELLLAFTEGARHTVPMVIATTTKASYRFRNTQEAEAFLAEVDVVRDRLEETLGEDGVLILPAATKTAPYHRQDIYFNESPEMTALFSILKMPATACPVMKSANGLPLAVQVVAKRGNDRLCLAVAREIERQFGGWIQPWVRN